MSALTLSEIDDILVTAFEGGIDYWVEGVRLDPTMPPITRNSERCSYQMITEGYWIDVQADVSQETMWHRLTLEKVQEGIRMFQLNNPGKDLCEDHDASDADTIVQYALWGEVIFS